MKSIFCLATISILLLSCVNLGTNTTLSKTSVSPTVYAETITQEDLKQTLLEYASDAFEGREAGTKGEQKATNFIKAHYIKYNVPAAKEDGDYFQNVPLELKDEPEINLTINGQKLNHFEDYVSVTPMLSNRFKTNEIIDLGYGIDAPKFSNYDGIDVKDKVVLFKSGEPKNKEGNYIISNSKKKSKWSNLRNGFDLKRTTAKNKGAKAVLFYHPEVFAMAALRYSGSSTKPSLAPTIKDNMYSFLINETAYKAINKGNTATNTVLLDYTNTSKALPSRNVVALIEGAEKPNEYIIISAHLDHEGVKNGEVYNGADDDGSGTVAMLEMAEAFAKAKADGHGPKRSIVFLNVTAEEKGLLGSKHYTDNDPIFPLKNTIANLNIDMIGRTDPKRTTGDRNYIYLIGSNRLSTDLHNISELVNTKYANIELDYTFNAKNDPNRFYYRSDHYNFAKHNVPAIFYFNGTHKDYHRPSDTVEKIEFDLLENRTRLIFYTAWELANRKDRILVDKAN